MQCQRVSAVSVAQTVPHTAVFNAPLGLLLSSMLFGGTFQDQFFSYWRGLGGVSIITFHGRIWLCLFYMLQMYQDGMYKPVTSSDRVIDVRMRHDCSSPASTHLCCLDENGNHAVITVFPYVSRVTMQAVSTTSNLCIASVSHWLSPWFVLGYGQLQLSILTLLLHLSCWIGQRRCFWNARLP